MKKKRHKFYSFLLCAILVISCAFPAYAGALPQTAGMPESGAAQSPESGTVGAPESGGPESGESSENGAPESGESSESGASESGESSESGAPESNESGNDDESEQASSDAVNGNEDWGGTAYWTSR